MTGFIPDWVPYFNGQRASIWLDMIKQDFWFVNNTTSIYNIFYDVWSGAFDFSFGDLGLNTALPGPLGTMPYAANQTLDLLNNLAKTAGGWTIYIAFNPDYLGLGGGGNWVCAFGNPRLPVGLPGNLFNLVGVAGTKFNPVTDPAPLNRVSFQCSGGISTPSNNAPFVDIWNSDTPPYPQLPFIFDGATTLVQMAITFDAQKNLFTLTTLAPDISPPVGSLPAGVSTQSVVIGSQCQFPFSFGDLEFFYLGGQPNNYGISNPHNVSPTGWISYFGIFAPLTQTPNLNGAMIPLPTPRYAENKRLVFYPWDKGITK